MRDHTLLVAVMLGVLLGADGTVAEQNNEYLGSLPLDSVPLEVKIGFNLVNITDVDEKEETIDRTSVATPSIDKLRSEAFSSS